MERQRSYRPAPQDPWVRRALPTTQHSLSAPRDLRQAKARIREDQPDLLLIETLIAVELCTRLLAQCYIQLSAVERRLYGVQQTQQPASRDSASAAVRLSKRELDVLRLVILGLDNQGIGGRLGISGGTVKNHMTSILSKLGARSRYEAVVKAQSLDLI